MNRCLQLCTCVVWLAYTAFGLAAEPKSSPDDLAFFEKRIRPVLVANCYACHSAQAPQVKGELLLDTREGMLRGGESGPAVVPKDPANSLLLQALRYADDAPAMPPKKQLPAEVVADFERWIALGAADPRDGKAPKVRSGIDIAKGRRFWAFVPPQKRAPPAVHDSAWPSNTIDRFLLSAIERRGLRPVADAPAHALLRRLYFDLTGLPPSIDDVEAFVAAYSPSADASTGSPPREELREEAQQDRLKKEQAVEALVDRLLASPHFGERWGRHWLDVARFAETSGRQVNFNYPQAWRYRDWVIAAFNADKPFDRFVREQIAGDLLPAADETQRASQLIATGFLALGPKPHSERTPLQFEMDLADEQIDVTCQAMLGLTVACARCHDHKFDPIPHRDYYALAGIFRSTETCYGTVRVIQSLNPSPLIDLPGVTVLQSALEPVSTAELGELKQRAQKLDARFAEAENGGKPTTGAEFNNRGLLKARIDNYTADGQPKLRAMGARERSVPIDSPLFARGEIDKPGEVVPRGALQVLQRHELSVPGHSSGRRELAGWLASRDNPLLARVFVNRVWTHLFGRGLVATPDNFGAAGMPPDHPQLLDDLAVSFMNDGWSVKRLVRRIVTSHAYRLGTHHQLENFEADPDNVLVWRMTPRRLDAEAIRDAMLDAAGELERRPPVGSPVALEGEGGSTRLLRQLTQIDRRDLHRAVYLPVVRDNVVESLALFDFADPSLIVSQRSSTAVPAQSLYLLNSPFVIERAKAAAARLLAESDEEATRLQRSFVRFLGRLPSEAELKSSKAFLAGYPQTAGALSSSGGSKASLAAWAAFCQALMGSADFLYRP